MRVDEGEEMLVIDGVTDALVGVEEEGVVVDIANNAVLSIAYMEAVGFAELIEEKVSFNLVALRVHPWFSNPLQQMLNCLESSVQRSLPHQ